MTKTEIKRLIKSINKESWIRYYLSYKKNYYNIIYSTYYNQYILTTSYWFIIDFNSKKSLYNYIINND